MLCLGTRPWTRSFDGINLDGEAAGIAFRGARASKGCWSDRRETEQKVIVQDQCPGLTIASA